MNFLQKVLVGVRNIGPIVSLESIRNALFRDLMESRFPSRPEGGEPQGPGALLDATPAESGARFRFEHASLEVSFLAPDLVRISWEPGEPPLPYALAEKTWEPVQVALEAQADGWLFTTPALALRVEPDGSLEWGLPDGASAPHLGALYISRPPLWEGEIVTQQAQLQPEEAIFGLGQQAQGPNLRGGSYRMWNSDPGGRYSPEAAPLYMPMPLYLGLHHQGSYLVFYENYFPATLNFPAAGTSEEAPAGSQARFEGGMLRYYFIPGPPPRALARYTELTGRAPLPPRWSLGYHQCRWGYRTESDVRTIAAGFAEHDMPVSSIHLDIDYMDGYRVFTVDRERFPDLSRLASDLQQQGIRLVSILDPGVKQDPDYFVYQEGIRARIFCEQPGDAPRSSGAPYVGLVWPGWALFPDFTDPQARAWWGQYYPRLLDQGIAGFWHDMNEPSSFSAWGDLTLPLPVRHKLEGRGGDHRQAHNLYGLLMDRAGFDALRQQRPERRPWILTRSGWAGMQRYAWTWTGDTESSWAALRMTVATVLNHGLSGVAYTGPDIGGHSGNPSPELYLRWFQLGALLPFFRVHSATGMQPREPWAFGEPTTTLARQALQLRYRLMPYLYSLAWGHCQQGAPLVRPLFWDQPQDERLWAVDDAFLLGEMMLVAPVLEEGAERRRVTLPEGGWIDFWNDQFYAGGESLEVECSLERIPLFVRAGGILPLEEAGKLELHVYLPPEGTTPGDAPELALYTDAGDGYEPGRVDRFRLHSDGEHLALHCQAEAQEAYQWPYAGLSVHFHGRTVSAVQVDGERTTLTKNRLEPDGLFRQIDLGSEA